MVRIGRWKINPSRGPRASNSREREESVNKLGRLISRVER
jgi:hypothetical protein